MKKFLNYATMAAALTFGLASCSQDVELGDSMADGDAVMSFTLKNPKGSLITRSIASDAEWAINSIDIYAFEGGSIIGTGAMQSGTDYDTPTGSASNNGISTIQVKREWLKDHVGKDVTFYFVANDQSYIPTTVTDTETQFQSRITTAMDFDTKVIETPLLFSAISTVTIKGRKDVDVELKRREARFDIVNRYADQGLAVKGIKISDAKKSGYIFSTGSGATIGKQSIKDALISKPVYAAHAGSPTPVAIGDVCGDYVYETVKTANGSSVDTYAAHSVFYLYPTELGLVSNGNDETELVIEAGFGADVDAYTLDTTTPIEIKPNTRYRLELDPLRLKFFVTAVDYEEGDYLETEGGEDNTLSLANLSANVVSNAVALSTTGATVTFDVETKYGTQPKVEYLLGSDADFASSFKAGIAQSTTVTYAGYTTKDVYTLTVPATLDANTAISIRVTIKSKYGKGEESILFTQGTLTDTDIIAILKGNSELLEAIKNALGNPATITPKDLEDVTTLDVSGENGPSSLVGIENLPNLKEINAIGNKNLTEVDLNGNPKLTKIEFTDTNISEIDLSNNTELDTVWLTRTKISTIDVSKNTKMTHFSIKETNVTDVDLSNNTLLEIVMIDQNPGFKKLDLSKQSVLREIVANYCPDLESIIMPNDVAPIERISLHDCKKIESIDLDAVQSLSLKRFELTSSLFTGLIDFTRFTNLQYLNMGNTIGAFSVDASNLQNLILFRFKGSTGLSTLKVDNTISPELDLTGTSLSVLDLSTAKFWSLNISDSSIDSITLYEANGIRKFQANNLSSLTINVWTGFDETTFTGGYEVEGTTVSYIGK